MNEFDKLMNDINIEEGFDDLNLDSLLEEDTTDEFGDEFEALFAESDEETIVDGELDEMFESFLGEVDDAVDDEMLGERSIVRLDKRAAKSKAIGLKALQIVKTENPSLYKKYKKAVALKLKLERAIVKRYSSKAKSAIQKNRSKRK